MTDRTIIIIRNAASQDFGGGERFPVFLSQILTTKSFRPIIVSRSRKLLAFADGNGIETIRGWWWSRQQWSGINNLFVPLYIAWQCVLFFYYIVLFSKQKTSIVHIQSKDDFIAATYAAKSLGIRTIWTDHADLKHIWRNISTWYKNPIGKMVYRAALRADAISVVSASELNLIARNLPANSPVSDKLTVIHNGVVDQAGQYKKQQNQLFTYLVASRLVTDKGINEVLAAFEKLSKEFDDIELQIIGDGPESDLFKKKAAMIKRVSLLGHQTQPLTFMANADVFVHPTYHEGFSVALVEASMMSLPIITTSVGGNPEIIKDTETGLLVPAKDSESLYDAMKTLYADDLLRKSLGKNARNQYVKKFQFDKIVEEEFIPLYGGVE